MEETKRFALLIDSDNVSAKYIKGVLAEMAKHGTVTYRRIYGDWTSTQMNKWKSVLAENSITPIQQFANTTGKNATDSILIIDAMDILYTGQVDGFCLVSSDSDFTRLASRLRESGMMVVGMGEEKTPKSFRSACSVFTSLEVLLDDDDTASRRGNAASRSRRGKGTKVGVDAGADIDADTEPDVQSNALSKEEVRDAIIDIINGNDDQGRLTGLGEIGSRLLLKYPDFDVRNFGYSMLSRFLNEFADLSVDKKEGDVFVSIATDDSSVGEVEAFIRGQVEYAGIEGVDLSLLGGKVHAEFPAFNVKDCGFSRFSKFVRSIDGVMIADDGSGSDCVYLDA